VTVDDARACLWDPARETELAHALARAAGIARPAAPEWFQLRHEELVLASARVPAPAFYRVDAVADRHGGGLLAVVGLTAREASVLAPDGGTRALPVASIAALLRAHAEAPVVEGVERVLARAGLPAARVDVVRGALVGAALRGEPVVQGWRVRAAAGSFSAVLRAAGLRGRLAATALAYAAQLALFVGAWALVGTRATAGDAGARGVAAWVAVLAALVVARFAASGAAGRLAVDVGQLLRARLINGVLALDTEPLRAEGVGQLLGRVMETEAVESLALGGGLLAMAGLFELVTSAVLLALGARGPAQLAGLVVATAVGAALATRFARALTAWSALRLGLTHDLVERMVGHRTLVLQQPPELRHGDETRALAAYDVAGRALDGRAAALAVLVPRAWLLVGVATLAGAFAAPTLATGLVATSLGGVLLAYGALRKLTQAFPALATAAIAWRQVEPLFANAGAAAPPPVSAPPSEASPEPGLPPALGAAPALIAARDLAFRYPGRAAPALARCSVEIRRGDHVLLEGPSGGGKSTFATLLAGLRSPDSGTLALDGVDQAALGLPRWRERVGVVPQFHENHVFSASLLFNLLMGRAWPPRREEVALAEQVCRELDLGGLIERMPSGLEQLVGESGWQLSHGERSRLYIARALLQRLDVRVLDESFAALDPETLERVLACVLDRAETLVVIAHP